MLELKDVEQKDFLTGLNQHTHSWDAKKLARIQYHWLSIINLASSNKSYQKK